MSSSKVHNIYLIDNELCKRLLNIKGKTTPSKKIIERIIQSFNNDSADGKYFAEVDIKNISDAKNFKLKLFYKYDTNEPSDLFGFLMPFVSEKQDIFNCKITTISTILFVFREDRIFAITTGQGFRVIEKYCVRDYGIKVISLFKNEFRLQSFDSNRINSSVHSNKVIYYDDIRSNSLDTFDTIYKEISGHVHDTSIIQSMLNEEHIKGLRCCGKNYIQLGKKIDINKLIYFLDWLDKNYANTMSDSFNEIFPMDENKNSEEIKHLNEELINKLKNPSQCRFKLISRNTQEYMQADSYRLEYKNKRIEINNIEDLSFIHKLYAQAHEEDFYSFINNTKIIAFCDNDELTRGSIIEHIVGDIEYGGKIYYILFGYYYYIAKEYIERINNALERLLPEHATSEFNNINWGNNNEDGFNKAFAKQFNGICLHKMVYDNVELADIMIVNDKTIKFIFVKDGFDGNMRILQKQIEYSSKLIFNARRDRKYEFLDGIYNVINKSQDSDIQKSKASIEILSSKGKFHNAICDYSIELVAVFRPKNKNILQSKSIIAKQCLYELIKNANEKGADIKIQIVEK